MFPMKVSFEDITYKQKRFCSVSDFAWFQINYSFVYLQKMATHKKIYYLIFLPQTVLESLYIVQETWPC